MDLLLTLTDEQLDQIAERVAVKMGKTLRNPLSIAQFAKEIGKSWPTVKSWVNAGIIVKSKTPGDTRIPYTELERYRSGK